MYTEGRMVGNPTRDRRSLQMLEDVYENNSYEVVKYQVQWRESTRKKIPKPTVQQTTKEEEESSHAYIQIKSI